MEYYDTHCNVPCILEKYKKTSYEEYLKIVEETYCKLDKKPIFKGCVCVASDKESHQPTKELEEHVYSVYGIHPLYCNSVDESVYDEISLLIQSKKCVALGETGLDYHEFPGMNYANKDQQLNAFKKQLSIAKQFNKPLVLHTREADEDTKQVMKELIDPMTFIDVHCYTGTIELAKWIIQEFPNAFIGIAGVITFKNGQSIRDLVKVIPLERILVETDGPFMAPVPFRGKPCHSGMIPWIIKEIARVKEVDEEVVYKQTTQNAQRMFSIE
ncbi:hydrolase TatD family protein [Entamoeba histolytica HM-3:IMSS]|uniref:Hydrolase TatD family protein n=4 Tax=Entamoeba histolytica TaxID=5759 RepID=C4LTQ7_ENTH1|nr:hydrolase TatD family protein [Entamoeba histolytica HM-1:IMSS]EAL43203.1 hydrolase TatD family protein [Entamoeba histolytica HM-1:IMSS]EMD43773.1 hydrolase TatD family protein [Entamoeba histolytica KU27]EMS11052.1 hydrolase TatD family protein [Entamoeba histolytica HM-3:IMSS]GAT91959.1 hydrolase tatd family protein [Entamoeba histolytica]|eukprot:XP_648592.1 hydrolase TatD family protein [Entamoeba histolytica HM-1:IMSS]